MLSSRTLAACAFVVALVAVVSTLVAPASRGQFAFNAQQIGNWWPPHPRDQVHLFQGSSVQIPPGGELEIYTVPADQWLVVVPTQFWGGGSGGHAALSGFGVFGGQGNNPVVLEDRGGQLITKCYPAFDGFSTGGTVCLYSTGPNASSPIGWTFAPGSRLIVKNQSPVAASSIDGYSIFGYLTTP